jgi:hypothetical protein
MATGTVVGGEDFFPGGKLAPVIIGGPWTAIVGAVKRVAAWRTESPRGSARSALSAWPTGTWRTDLLKLLFLFGGQDFLQPRVDVPLQLIELLILLVAQFQTAPHEGRENLPRSRRSTESTGAAPLPGTTCPSTLIAAGTSWPPSPAEAPASLCCGAIETSRSVTWTATTSGSQCRAFLFEQLRQLVLRHHAVTIRISPFKQRSQSLVGELVLTQLAIIVGIKSQESCHERFGCLGRAASAPAGAPRAAAGRLGRDESGGDRKTRNCEECGKGTHDQSSVSGV